MLKMTVEQSGSLEEAPTDFSYVNRISPDTSDLIKDLQERVRNGDDYHAQFWLEFLSKYNVIASGMRDSLEDEGIGIQGHEEAVSDWLSQNLTAAVELTSSAHFFRRVRGEFEMVDAGYAYEFVTRPMDREEILDNEPLIFEIPTVLTDLLKAPTN